MGEAKRRKETGELGQKDIFSDSDACPLCGKNMVVMKKEHGDNLLTLASGSLVICWKCGNIFFPKSRLKHFAKVATGESVIVDPNSPIGQATQQAASKIVLPGVGK